jgi:hypothetical protein
MPVDLRIPTGFEGVYQFERPGPLGQPETMYMRANGSLTAVFPRSVYVTAPNGLVPEIPAGTVFVIGSPLGDPWAFGAKRGRAASPFAIDQRITDSQAGPPRPAAAPHAVEDPASIWASERTRQRRLAELMAPLGVR